ncbi:MAG: S-(hydroxymethyl)glutathione dehydrogenase / alcohol dehydrogenase [Pseudonocardiales bacterium]|jgi:S-(hydroxymethyl)glutathione dehydrogenase/alcohol dehydrogenase|nr:S-(hydroxymethyl)glutathione dehydrogenase / alcohol dehydrogenase [Pseudonocardiales bacterium]
MTKALLSRGPKEDLEVVDIVLGETGPNQVRVAVRAAGVCHSDLSMVNGTVSPSFPLVLGHEASGVVAEVGPAVTRVAVGDHVVLNWSPPCRVCWFCRKGEPWLCQQNAGVASRPGGQLSDGTPTNLTLGIGAFAEEVLVDERAVISIAKEVPLAEAALIGCAVLTGFGAVRHTAAVQPGDSVAVIGLGGVGLAVVEASRLVGADPVIAVDRSTGKQPLAIAAGATHFIASSATTTRQIRALTEGRGVEHSFECVGRSATIRDAWQSARRGGSCIVVGMGGADDQVQLSALEIFHYARTLRSSVYGSADPDVDVPQLAELALSKQLDLGALISHRVELDDVESAFERMYRGEGARTLVVFD